LKIIPGIFIYVNEHLIFKSGTIATEEHWLLKKNFEFDRLEVLLQTRNLNVKKNATDFNCLSDQRQISKSLMAKANKILKKCELVTLLIHNQQGGLSINKNVVQSWLCLNNILLFKNKKRIYSQPPKNVPQNSKNSL